MNFGLACERFKAISDIRCEMFINADDTALVSADKTAGRRGEESLLLQLPKKLNLATSPLALVISTLYHPDTFPKTLTFPSMLRNTEIFTGF